MLIEIIFLQELSQGLIQQSTLTFSQSCSHSKEGFSKKKKDKRQKTKIFKKKKKKKRRKFSKKALGLGALDSYFLGCLKGKINQNFQFHEKIKDFQNFQKKKKKKKEIFKKGLGTRGIGLVLLRLL